MEVGEDRDPSGNDESREKGRGREREREREREADTNRLQLWLLFGPFFHYLAIGLNAVLEAVELPACIADLDPGLANVDTEDLRRRRRRQQTP